MALKQISHVADSELMDECIDNCSEAAQACEWCADECIGMGEEMARCIRLCRDVADLTSLHARFMSRNSGYSAELAEICADACEECADECEQFDHEHCQVCADKLRDCVDSCREMASA
ncbi:four-helix bundle copper-binding protein [Halovivax limisalsi]|uniref:four-helix bundle copper-binding protein n=1 Tax=Halovivax limisalsi TaxID=1453760 RepID=UPI001FFD240E|nr:four-helix bundle copper-binding protein [Halovivax limisalsi]